MKGQLYTVNPIAVNSPMVNVFTSNKRVVVLLETTAFGLVAFVAVGATLVGSIRFTVQEGDAVTKGQELGYFAFGGSTCILLVRGGLVHLDSDLQRMSTRCAARRLRVHTPHTLRELAWRSGNTRSHLMPFVVQMLQLGK